MSINYISSKSYNDEIEHIKMLLDYINIDDTKHNLIGLRAHRMVEKIRDSKVHTIESFIQEYSLSTEEGVAIICLAESLLRIPDKKTAHDLVSDKLSGKNWQQHLGKSESLFVNASSWGLLLTGKVIDFKGSDSLIAKMVGRIGEPMILEGIKRAIGFISNKFILGKDLEDALKNGKTAIDNGYNLSFDILGESSRTDVQAEFYYNEYLEAIKVIGKLSNKSGNIYQQLNLSVKLSALHPKVMLRKIDLLKKDLLPKLKNIVKLCINCNISISFDAEESYRQDVYLLILEELIKDPELKDFSGTGFVIQSYSKRAFYIIDWIANLALDTKKCLPVRLVKGAYWDTEIKHSQENGLIGYPVFTKKEHTDISYIACAQKLLSYQQYIFPQFATHNAITASTIIEIGQGCDFEFQRLQGMGESLHNALLEEGYKSRIYAPVGKYEDLLAYLMRRLLENGANSSFVNLIGDKNRSLDEIVESPILKIKAKEISCNKDVALPVALYKSRINSRGIEIGIKNNLEDIRSGLDDFRNRFYESASIISGRAIKNKDNSKKISRCSNKSEIIGQMFEANDSNLKQALENASSSFASWSSLKAEDRSDIINRFADLLQKNHFEIYSILISEAGKNIDDAINELREAIDFARYYANMAIKLSHPINLPSYTGESSTMSWHPRGVFVCISPWNFPLAIFLGQILAALVTGNTVIAKPAENTTIIASYAINLLIKAGVDKNAISLLLTSGRKISETILTNNQVKGVCFTGSTIVAQNINRTLAARDTGIASFIAETGGQNAMIVDSSALLEQACDSIVNSAFGSIGQRCSALRVLYIQEEIFDKLIELVSGATDQLAIADTYDLTNDLGPVIDIKSRDELLKHVENMMSEPNCKLLYTHHDKSKIEDQTNSFIAPRIIKINHISDLKQENFGPILHVISFKSEELDQIIDQINSSGFGLTCGIQTRIEERIDYVASKIKVGNFYANRSIIGAQVGTHPFGGEGNSGTGFKAGGPHYLMRFMTERVKTVNTAAIGGNIELLC
jgi:RHH-type proline utilization regulon transcriptional repressor/proline dehydrogenase/delta 1-pyrroline-5-carboxylate dehydrogenase